MAVTQGDIRNHNVPPPGGFRVEFTTLDFTSTTATVELKTKLSVVLGFAHVRIGAASANHGDLSINETLVAGAIPVTGGAFTVDRHLSDVAGTLGTESFLVTLFGY